MSFLGKGGAFSRKYHNTSAYLEIKNTFILFDCGEDVFKQILVSNMIKDNISEIDIIITHMHSDHIGSLGSLLFYVRFKKIKANVIFPNKDKIENYLLLQGLTRDSYNLLTPREVEKYFLEEYTQIHGDVVSGQFMPIEAYGYHYKDEDNNFFYSGDANGIPDKILEKFLKKEINHLYQEVTDDNWPTHTSLEYLIKKIPIKERKRISLMHISDSFDVINTNGFNVVEEILHKTNKKNK